MYAAGSSSSSSDDVGSPWNPRHQRRRSHGVLKCFILTPTAQYVNPIFADLFNPASDHHDDNVHRGEPTGNATTTHIPGDALAAAASDASSPSSKPSPHHHPMSLRLRRPGPSAAAATTTTTTTMVDPSSSSPNSSALRSPASTTSFSASPPASSLLKHVLVPTPPHSTTATDDTATASAAETTPAKTTGGSTLASSSSSSPESGAGTSATKGSRRRSGSFSLASPPSMYHSLLHPSPSSRSGAAVWMPPLSTASSSAVARSASKPNLPPGSVALSVASTSAASSAAPPLSSLGALAQRFVRLVRSSQDGPLEVNEAVLNLGVGKRRIYDITNVLEGIGLIRKVDKNHFEWTDPDPHLAMADVDADPHLLGRVEALRKEVRDLADAEAQVDEYLACLRQQSSLPFVDACSEGVTSSPPLEIEHMYVRYSDVTDLHDFYGSDTVIGVKAPAGTNLEVPDPEQGMEVGKRRYQMFLSSKLPDGSYPLGAKDNRGPIRVYLVRPEAKPGESVASSRPAQMQPEGPTHNGPKQALKPPPTRGSYVESDSASAAKRLDATPRERGPKRPYVQSTHRAAQPYISPLDAPHHPSPYSYYSDVSSSPWNQHSHYYYHPAYYPPMPAPPAASGELITPANDGAKTPAKQPKRKRSSRTTPAGGTPLPHRPDADMRVSMHPVEPWGYPPAYDTVARNLAGHGVGGHPQAFLPASSGPPSPFWPRSLVPDVAAAAFGGSPLRHPREEASRRHPENKDPSIPSSPLLSPAAVDPSELFSMPLHSPPGPRQEGAFGVGNVGGGGGSVDRSIALSPGASAPPGFSPRRTYVVGPPRRNLPDPVHLSLASTTPPRRPEAPQEGTKKNKNAKSGRAAVDPVRGGAYRRRQHEM